MTPFAAKVAMQDEGRDRMCLLGITPNAAASAQRKSRVPVDERPKLNLSWNCRVYKKGIFNYGNSKRKSKENIGPILDEDGHLVNREGEKAGAFNGFYASSL